MTSTITRYLRSHHIALLALFVALGGTSYAAVTLPKGSVGATQLKKSAVTSPKVKDGSLLEKDFKAGQLPAGPKGDKGDPGAPGPPAPPVPTEPPERPGRPGRGPSNAFEDNTNAALDVTPSGATSMTATCRLLDTAFSFIPLHQVSVELGASDPNRQAIALVAGTNDNTVANPRLDVQCKTSAGTLTVSNVSLTAIQASDIDFDQAF